MIDPHASAARGGVALRPTRRQLLALLGVTAAQALPSVARAAWPEQPIRLVVPAPAGGAMDLFARALATALATSVGQPVRVENIVGAGGLIGALAVTRSAPDGTTIVVVHSGLIAAQTFNSRLDLLRDLAPVARLARSPLVLVVRSDAPFTSLQGLVAAAQAAPGRLSYASGGIGSPAHEAVVELAARTGGLDAVHVPYGGAADGATALLRGDIDFEFGVLAAMLPLIEAGRLRALAVTGAGRVPLLPDVPTVAECGVPGFSIEPWAGIAAPAGTPPDIVTRLDAALLRSLDAPGLRALMARLGMIADHADPAAFRRQIALDVQAQALRNQRLGPKIGR